MKLGYGIKGIFSTNFAEVENESDAVKFLRETGEEIAYAFVIDETGEATDLRVGTGATWE
jgi:hypothetical protein